MTSALEVDECSQARPGRSSLPGKHSTHLTGGWMDTRAGIEGRITSSLLGFDPRPPARSQSPYRPSYLAHCKRRKYSVKAKTAW